MKKQCIFCGRDIETEISSKTKEFLVCETPCICSDCVEILFGDYVEISQKIDDYRICMNHLTETILMNYPEKWTDELEKGLIKYYIENHEIIGQKVSEEIAELGINRVKEMIDKNPNGAKILRKSESSQAENDFVDIECLEENEYQKDFKSEFKQIIAEVESFVKGQDNAVEEIGRVIFHNQQCARYNDEHMFSGGNYISKENILLVGPTGTGKTATVTKYCELLKIPYVIADMTSYTQAGYIGGNIEDIFRRLLKNADNNLSLAQKGIVIMDEGDKNASNDRETGVDVGGKGVLDSMLKKIEGCEIDLGKGIIFNSTDTTFIASGVYPDLYDIRKDRVTGKKAIGFGVSETKVTDLGEFIAEDFVKHGFPQEYIGRFSAIVELNRLSDDIYLDILRNAKGSAFKQYKDLFKYAYGIELSITPEGEASIIEKAKHYNVGARGLHRALAKLLSSTERMIIMTDEEYTQVIIEENCSITMV